jgi:hypothetical protein
MRSLAIHWSVVYFSQCFRDDIQNYDGVCVNALWDVVLYRETTTYCSDIQAFIVVICYTDGLTARWR